MGRTVSAGRRSRGWEAAAARASPRLRRRPSPPPQASCALGSGGSESGRSPAAGPRLPVWGWRGCGPGPWRGCSARGCGPGPWVPAPGRPVPRNPGGGLRSLRRVAAVPRWPCGAVCPCPPARSVGRSAGAPRCLGWPVELAGHGEVRAELPAFSSFPKTMRFNLGSGRM